MILNQQQSLRRTSFSDNAPEPKKFSAHVESRLEEYYGNEPRPNDAQSALLAFNLGIKPWHFALWFHHRRERDTVSKRLAAVHPKDGGYESGRWSVDDPAGRPQPTSDSRREVLDRRP